MSNSFAVALAPYSRLAGGMPTWHACLAGHLHDFTRLDHDNRTGGANANPPQRRGAKNLDPLRTHKWNAAIEREEGLIIAAERGGHRHTVGLIYTSATDNKIYKSLATEVEHIFFNGQPYRVQEYAYGLDSRSVRRMTSIRCFWSGTGPARKESSFPRAKTRQRLRRAPRKIACCSPRSRSRPFGFGSPASERRTCKEAHRTTFGGG